MINIAMKKITTCCFTLLISFCGLAQIGSLDQSFDTDGKQNLIIGSYATGESVAIQTDGKIVVGASSIIGTHADISLIRYKPDGSLDSTFNNIGILNTDINNTEDYCADITIQPDGKILACGYSMDATSNKSIVLIRCNSNGTFDNTFGNAGKVSTTYAPSTNYGQDILVQQDGKIVVIGYVQDTSLTNHMIVLRYLTNGVLDSSFNNIGIKSIDFGGLGSYGMSIAQQIDGKLIAVGYYNQTAGNTKIALARLNIDGSFDTTFDSDGIQTSSLNACVGNKVKLQADGKIVVVGFRDTIGFRDFALLRFKTNGGIDSSFNQDGIVSTKVANYQNNGYDLAIQSNGAIVIAGGTRVFQTAPLKFTLVRYTIHGDIDSSFDNDGIVITDLNSTESYIRSIAIQADKKIVAVGSSNSEIALTRYNNSNFPDNIENKNISVPILIYPNPCSTSSTIIISKDIKDATIILSDFNGKVVQVMKNLYGSQFILQNDHLPSGIYHLSILENNQQIASRKIEMIR